MLLLMLYSSPCLLLFQGFLLPAATPFLWLHTLLPDALAASYGLWAAKSLVPMMHIESTTEPERPDYGDEGSWAARPDFENCANVNPPGTDTGSSKESLKADVFYLHPSTFYSTTRWSADVDDPFVRFMTDDALMTQQASAFNGAGRVFAPRWRQMTAWGYFDTSNSSQIPAGAETHSRTEAMRRGYEDVRSAWKYYVEKYNPGLQRPFILAAHSQGTEHAIRLLQDRGGFNDDGTAFTAKLIAAYLVGAEVYPSVTGFPVCRTPRATGCIVGWQSHAVGSDPSLFRIQPATASLRHGGQPGEALLCVNPLSWEYEGGAVPREANPGTMHILQWWQNLAYLVGPRMGPGDRSATYQEQMESSVPCPQPHCSAPLTPTPIAL